MKKIFICIVLLALLGFAPAHSNNLPDINQIRTAYLFNVAKFISWPENSFDNDSAPLVIGIVEQPELAASLSVLQDKKIRQHPIEIRDLSSLNSVAGCHIIYLSDQSRITPDSLFDKVGNRAILTIGDDKSFAREGGILQFVTIRGRLRFIVNLDVAKRQQISIDSQLLALALEVIEVKK